MVVIIHVKYPGKIIGRAFSFVSVFSFSYGGRGVSATRSSRASNGGLSVDRAIRWCTQAE
jgi:hypothetical protein